MMRIGMEQQVRRELVELNRSEEQIEMEKQVERILNPSQSRQNMLQEQFQSKIQSIEECLTSRSNFLIMFQQMLQQQMSSIEQGQQVKHLVQSNNTSIKISQQGQIPAKEINSSPQLTSHPNKEQCLSPEEQLCGNNNRKEIGLIKLINKKFTQLRQQFQTLKNYISSSIQFLKLELVKQIFTSNLKKIVDEVDQRYMEKYQQYRRDMIRMNDRMKEEYKQQISVLKQLLIQKECLLKQHHRNQFQQPPSFRPQLNHSNDSLISKNNERTIPANSFPLISKGFRIQLPQQLPSIRSHKDKSNSMEFVTLREENNWAYNGYVQNNQFASIGTLHLHKHHILYEGEFLNHEFHGKGKLTLHFNPNINLNEDIKSSNLSLHISRGNSIEDKQNLVISKRNSQQIIVIGKFINNRIEGYAKILTSEKEQQYQGQMKTNINYNKSKSANRNTSKRSLMVLFKNNTIINTL